MSFVVVMFLVVTLGTLITVKRRETAARLARRLGGAEGVLSPLMIDNNTNYFLFIFKEMIAKRIMACCCCCWKPPEEEEDTYQMAVVKQQACLIRGH